MIYFSKGNLLYANVQALVNAVNTRGVMGAGIALQFKKAYPDMFDSYKKSCESGELKIGKLHVYEYRTLVGPKYIINFPTKEDWKNPSKMEYITLGLQSLVETVKQLRIESIAIPPLGCGHGKLLWKDVLPLIESSSQQIPDVKILVFPPTSEV